MAPSEKETGSVCLNHGKICANIGRALEENARQWEVLEMLKDKQAGKKLVWSIVSILVIVIMALGGYFTGRMDTVNAFIPQAVEQSEKRLVSAIQEGKHDRNKALENIGGQLETHNKSLAQIQVNQSALVVKVDRIEKVVDRLDIR